MAKLYFRYGAMGASKTANMLMVRYNYIERGQEVLLLKPSCEKRDGKMIIKSRIGLEAECIYVEEFLKAFLEKPAGTYDMILMDIMMPVMNEHLTKPLNCEKLIATIVKFL